ncbi:hypothetical protein CK203_060320 [Vitis vinifera]|uniref:Uncharacterized protein n=1 Tax=Vitis vinifera TaxID=29760 RepID=A0A438FRY5_VITVI|nr:hypothetical protein CK203_060320 [Vitis vinifera]
MKLSPNTSNSSSSLIPTSVISFQNAETDANGGIEAIRQKLMLDLREVVDKMRHSILEDDSERPCWILDRMSGLYIFCQRRQNCFIASGTTLMQNMYYLNGLEVTPSVAYVIITNFMYYLNAPQATPSVAYVIIRNFKYYLNALKVTPTVPYVIIRNFKYYLNAHKSPIHKNIEIEQPLMRSKIQQGLSESSSKMECLILSAASLRSSMSFWRMASIPPLASVSAFWNEITDVGMREDEELENHGIEERETMELRRDASAFVFSLRDGWGV